MIYDENARPVEETLIEDYDDADDYSLFSEDPDHYEVMFVNLSEGERSYLVNTFESNRRRWRREHQVVLRHRERIVAKTKRLCALFVQDKIWAAEGGNIAIKDMTPNHARNSYNLITRDWRRYAGAEINFSDLKTGYPNIHSTPLGQALFKRSQKRTTWRHRRRDNEARERFKDRKAKAAAIASNVFHRGEW